MSHPVTRRIARAALIVAAGAAPVVAAAGSAQAATPPKAPDLGGLSTLDSASAGQTLDNTAKTGAGLLNAAGKEAAVTVAPAVVKATGPVVKELDPAAHYGAVKATRAAAEAAKKSTSAAAPAHKAHGPLGLLGGLPVVVGH
ncbi:ATP-binding protein [Streptomyces sp. NPDC048650]|uniref:ATP-binding protein n=1 Tax=unclassified Streptomyces TaxID=2593676 RepID=UPI00371B11BC